MAATVTDTLVEILPTDADWWLHRAVALCQLGQMQEAHAALVITFELQPDLRVAARFGRISRHRICEVRGTLALWLAAAASADKTGCRWAD